MNLFIKVTSLIAFLTATTCLPSPLLALKTVTISGGTHGNEYTGIWCIKAIEKQRELYNDASKIISSEILAMHVLEINANLADKYNIKVGDHINLIKKNANL